MHYWKQREVLGCASHYMRGVKSCKIMSVLTGLNCLCAGYWNPNPNTKGIMAFAASGRFLLLVPERRAVRESRWRWWLVSARGYCRHMAHSTDGKIRHQWQKTENVSQWHVCHKLWFLPLSNEKYQLTHTTLIFVDFNADLWMTPSRIHWIIPFFGAQRHNLSCRSEC